MSLQNIINNATTIVVQRTKIASTTVSRSGRFLSGLQISNQPFTFAVVYQPMATYANVRDVLEEIDRLDAVHTEEVEIGSSNSGLSWITAYQGDLTPTQIGQITVDGTPSGKTIDLDLSAVTGASASDVVLKKGDYFQLDAGYKYPYTVQQDVTYGIGGTVSVNLNRPFITQSGYTTNNQNILVGNDVTWTVKMLTKPSYELLPSRYVQFTNEFQLVEVIEG